MTEPALSAPGLVRDVLAALAEAPLEGRRGLVVSLSMEDVGQVAARGVARPSQPPDAYTLFEIGSITKVFTSLLLADLVLSGELSLDQPVRELLPDHVDLPTREGREITLGQLANHTSGLPRLPPGLLLRRFARDPYAGYDAKRLYRVLGRLRLLSAPGETYRYSNLGGGLLGHALAVHTGMSYQALVETRIAAPLGLPDTTTALTAAQEMRAAVGYTDLGRPAARWHFSVLAGAGALWSTATDLQALCALHLSPGDTPLGRAAALTLQPTASRPGGEIGLGWHLERIGSANTMAWHNGGTAGFRSFVAIVPAVRVAVVVLSNTAAEVDRLGVALVHELATGTRRRPLPLSPRRRDAPVSLARRAYPPIAALAALALLIRDLVPGGPGAAAAILPVCIWIAGTLTILRRAGLRLRPRRRHGGSPYVRPAAR